MTVYFVQAGDGGPIKIGVADDVGRRVAGLQTACPSPLKVLATLPGNQALEAALHGLLAEHRLHGEWFRADAAVLGMPDLIEAIAQSTAAILEERLASRGSTTPDGFLSADVAAEQLRVSRAYIWRLVRQGKLEGRKVGGRVWVVAASVERRAAGERSLAHAVPAAITDPPASRGLLAARESTWRPKPLK